MRYAYLILFEKTASDNRWSRFAGDLGCYGIFASNHGDKLKAETISTDTLHWGLIADNKRPPDYIYNNIQRETINLCAECLRMSVS